MSLKQIVNGRWPKFQWSRAMWRHTKDLLIVKLGGLPHAQARRLEWDLADLRHKAARWRQEAQEAHGDFQVCRSRVVYLERRIAQLKSKSLGSVSI